jgi:hypothetical protein
MIVLGEGDERNMQAKCTTYSIIGNTKDSLSRPDEWMPIYHCRGFEGELTDDLAGTQALAMSRYIPLRKA